MERKPEFKTVSLRTETAYKADEPGKVAQRTDTQGSGSEVNAEVAQLQFAFLSGETPQAQAERGVSRRHSTSEVKEGRPEPDRCHSTTDPQPAAGTPNGRAVALEELDGKHGEAQVNLLEQILSRENMLSAWKRVKANKGAAGMDGGVGAGAGLLGQSPATRLTVPVSSIGSEFVEFQRARLW